MLFYDIKTYLRTTGDFVGLSGGRLYLEFKETVGLSSGCY